MNNKRSIYGFKCPLIIKEQTKENRFFIGIFPIKVLRTMQYKNTLNITKI